LSSAERAQPVLPFRALPIFEAMDYEEADLVGNRTEASEAEIVRDFSQGPGPKPSDHRRRWPRILVVVAVLVLALFAYRGCTVEENTPDSELSSTESAAAANLEKAASTLREIAPPAGTSAAEISISLEELARVPVGIGSANEPGEVGVKVRGDLVVLETSTRTGRKTATYRLK
jgi:hypothetical protein